MSRKTTIAIAAGGTGGHIFPGLAVAEELRARECRVLWIGVSGGMEERIVPASGHEFLGVRFASPRGGTAQLAKFPFSAVSGITKALTAMIAQKPAAVLGMGGYASFPGALAAWLSRKPLLIHEQNSVPGMANRFLAKLASHVMESFPGTFGKNGRVVGNPVRAAFSKIPAPAKRFSGREGALRILVMGGSQGARALNDTLAAAISTMDGAHRPKIVHQCGHGNSGKTCQAYADAGIADADVREFIDDIAGEMSAADLVVCRAGAATISELCAAGCAAILVPYPHSADDHQLANARNLESQGAALVLEQRNLSKETLAKLISGVSRQDILVMAEKAAALGCYDAAERIADACMEATGAA